MSKLISAIRERTSAGSLRLLSAPYLPDNLTWAALLIAYTDCLVILFGQPAGYWIDNGRAASQVDLLRSLIASGVLPYLLVVLAYLTLLWLTLTVLTRSLALVIWLTVSFMHVSHGLAWLAIAVGLGEAGTLTGPASLVLGAIAVLILSILLVKLLLPRTFEERTTRWLRLRPFLYGGWTLGLLGIVLVSGVLPRGGWMRLQPEHSPGRRAISAVAYDSDRGRLVLFGGISDWIGSSYYYEHDTWEWDGHDWIQVHPQNSPQARAGHAMAYDPKHKVVVLFGGEEKSGTSMFNDTWTWDGVNWTRIFPSSGYPMARRGAQMFYDPAIERIVLTGGFYYAPGKVFTAVNDTWAWNGQDWEYISTLPENLMITNPNTVQDPGTGKMWLYDYKRMLSWAGDHWQMLNVDGMPPSRFGTWLAADPESGRMLMFGGVENSVQRSDTWLFDAGTWRELKPGLTPSPRDAHVMFYDPVRKSFIVYGGISTYALDDMWEYVLPPR